MTANFRYWPLFVLALGITLTLNTSSLFRESIRLDEAQSIWVAGKSVPELLRTTSQDVQPPLYLLFLHFWTRIFSSDVLMARLPSLLFFLLTLPFLYRLLIESANRETAVLGVVLYSFSPFILWYSQEARTYSLITLLATINHLYFLRFLRSSDIRFPTAYFLTSLLGIYSHYFFIFFLISQGIYFFLYLYRHRLQIKPVQLVHFLYVVLGVIILFTPWLLYLRSLGFAANTQPRLPSPTSYNLIQIYLNFLVGFLPPTAISFIIALWPLLLMILFYIFTRRLQVTLKSTDYFVQMTFLPVFLVYIVSIFRPIFLPRYLIFVAPSLFVLLSWTLVNFTKKSISLPLLIILIIMSLALNLQNRSAITPVKENYAAAAAHINSAATAHDIVAISSPFTIYPVEYYYHAPSRIITIPQWNRYQTGAIPPFKLEEAINQIDEYKKYYDRIFLLTSYDQGYELELVNYFDTHFHRLEITEFSPGITLRVYRLGYFE